MEVAVVIYFIIGVCIGILSRIGKDYFAYERGFTSGAVSTAVSMQKSLESLQISKCSETQMIRFELCAKESKK